MCILWILLYLGDENMGSTKYITSMGELSRKDNSLCFRKNGKNIYIPIENTINNTTVYDGKLEKILENTNLIRFFRIK